MKTILHLLFLVPLVLYAETFLVFGGKTGWIGQQLVYLLQEQGHSVFCAESRLENREELIREIEQIQPDFIFNAAGLTGNPNVDWCEEHRQETLRANLLGALNLADVALSQGIHVTQFGTGCIYTYDETHPIGTRFTEEDPPNFAGSFYSKTKGILDGLLAVYPNVLNLRLRMPLSADFHPKNLIIKLTRYAKLINIPNSMTVLEDLLPVAIELALRKKTGTYNFTNPGTLSHNELMQLYKEYIDPAFTWENFTLEEQDLILKAPRSNNELDVSKLLQEFPDIPPIEQSIRRLFEEMRAICPQAREKWL